MVNIFFCDRADKLVLERNEAVHNSLYNCFLSLHFLDFLVNSLFDEDSLESAQVELVCELAFFEFKLVLDDSREFSRVILDDFGCRHCDRHVVLDYEHLAGN